MSPRTEIHELFTAVIILFVAFVIALITATTYAHKSARYKQLYEQTQKEFLACQRGQWSATTLEGVEIGCMPLVINGRI